MKRSLLLITTVVLGFAQFAVAEDQKPEEKGRPVARGKGASGPRNVSAGPGQQSLRGGGGPRVNGYRAQQRASFSNPQPPAAHVRSPEFNGVPRTRSAESNRGGFNRSGEVPNQPRNVTIRDNAQGQPNVDRTHNFRGRDSGRANFTTQDRAARRAAHGGNWYSNGGLRFAQARERHGRDYHQRSYWRSHYNRFARFGGGYYFYDAGYWYPAYGYDSGYNNYSYDGPIYGYNELTPDQVLMNVQVALQEDGYYQGEIDGDIGPQTRRALAAYQEANGLEITAAVDPATLASLGLS